jgi:hypothetical protein
MPMARSITDHVSAIWINAASTSCWVPDRRTSVRSTKNPVTCSTLPWALSSPWPGVGKSTLAQRYVDQHPGSLNLDIETVASLISGWRHDFFGVFPAARNIAVAMAATHLRSGSDVVLLQLLTILDGAQRCELAAERAGPRISKSR